MINELMRRLECFRSSSNSRLKQLLTADPIFPASATSPTLLSLDLINDRWGRAGYFTSSSRKSVLKRGWLLAIGTGLVGATLAGRTLGVTAVWWGLLIGVYLGVGMFFYYLQTCRTRFQRRILLELPLVIEELLLLVESGLAVFPAFSKIVQNLEQKRVSRPLLELLDFARQLTAGGIPFRKSLEVVAERVEQPALKHALLHLQMSVTDGAQLIPSLRSLAEYTSCEWKISVEKRVKQLEALVVFPVFCAVIGLLLLVSAGPLSRLVEFSKHLETNKSLQSANLQ